ncbi:DNA-binding transcriptional regulator, LysR family [Raineyella antarctica]|uniref:DNA-binding transcriptional regulator, LysR family n=1 Tax=Raineyella antarctica TaxID=1577474 RepID=A0A1G6GMW6_9ACTN|nr:LysR family transcriptional regulator [Raineyella antarctica]SDB83380.1 DNA-binding transcriptional regulator, LysR family [Raineyella antarctica]
MTQCPSLEVLGLLVAVAEHGSLGAGARAVGMAEPNASRAVRRLERELGLVLFRRTPRGSQPTDAGQLLVAWARPLLAQADALALGLRSLESAAAGELDVAASMTIAEHLVPGWLARLRRQHPNDRVHLRIENSAEVARLVHDGEVDLGFVEVDVPTPGLRHHVVTHDRLHLVVAPGHPWQERTAVAPDELARTPLVTREVGSGTRAVLEHALAPRILAPAALVLNSNAGVRASVRAGVAPAVLSELVVEDLVRAGHLVVVPIEGLDLVRPLHAVWRTGQPPRGIAAQLVAVAEGAVTESGTGS